MSGLPRTFDLRLWVDLDRPGPALERFFAAVRELALEHDGIEPRWIAERRDRHGRPRVHLPPRFDNDNDAGTPAEGGKP
jgi:hypothetical protein